MSSDDDSSMISLPDDDNLEDDPVRVLLIVPRYRSGIVSLRSALLVQSQELEALVVSDGWNAPAIQNALIAMRNRIIERSPALDGNWFSGFVRADFRD